jgi:hypothetical protein
VASGQGLVQHGVDVPDALHAQAAALAVAPTRGEKLGVEGVEMFGRELLKGHRTNGGHHVEFDVVAVGVEGARSQLSFLGRKPLVLEVLAEGDTVRRAVVAVLCHLYAKLGVHRRRDAVDRGRAPSGFSPRLE